MIILLLLCWFLAFLLFAIQRSANGAQLDFWFWILVEYLVVSLLCLIAVVVEIQKTIKKK